MKILHLISQHPESTGSGYYLQNIIRQATTAGHQNYLIAGISGNNEPALDCIGKESCHFVRFGQGILDYTIPGMSDVMPYPSSRFGELASEQIERYEQSFSEAIDFVVRDFCPDIIHSHHLWLVSAVARGLFPGLPMVTSCHSSELRQFIQCPQLATRAFARCQKIDRVLALSRDQVEQIERLYSIPPRHTDIVGGGYDEELFSFQPKKKAPPVQMLYAGKLSFAKGVDLLLEAFQGFSGEEVHLHIAGSGSGPEAQQCLEQAARLGSSVTVHGRINQQELARLMGDCHIFVLPSLYEGLPLVLLEALATGCRIITTDLPGCVALLGKEESDLVEFVRLPVMDGVDKLYPEDVPLVQGRFEKAIRSMVCRAQSSVTPSSTSIEKIVSGFRWKAVFNRITNAYEKAINS